MIRRLAGWNGLLCLLLGLVVLVWSSSLAEAAGSPWPMAHGNAARNGRASVNGPAIGQPFWSLSEVGEVFSSPVIGPDGTIYIISGSLYAVSPEGTILWSFDPGPCGTNCQTVLAGAAAVGSDGTIYLPFGVHIGQGGGGPVRGVVALSPSGIEQWRWVPPYFVIVPDLLGAFHNGRPLDLLIGPDGTIYGSFTESWCSEPDHRGFCPPGKLHSSGNVEAISGDGNRVWGRPMQGHPTEVALGSGRLFFGRNYLRRVVWPPMPPEHELIAVDVSTGDTVWWLDLRSIGWVGDPAVGADGTIYVAIGGEALYAFGPDGTEKWSLSLEGPAVAKPAIGADGTLYLAYAATPEGNSLTAVQDTGSAGSILWTIPLAGVITSSPAVDAAGVIYVGFESMDGTGKVMAFNPNGTLKWEVELESPPYSPLALQEGFLYVGGSLHAIKSLPATVGLEKTAVDLNGPPVWQGDIIEYTIVITNRGGPQGDNPGNEFEDPIPEKTAYVAGSASASSGTISLEKGDRIVWNGSIPPLGTVTLRFQVQVGPGGAPLGRLPLLWAGLGVLVVGAGFGLRKGRKAFFLVALMVSLMLVLSSCVGAPITVCNQGVFHLDSNNDGTNDTDVLTDDPATPTVGDPTCL